MQQGKGAEGCGAFRTVKALVLRIYRRSIADEPEFAGAAPLEQFLESPSELLRADVVMEDEAVVVRLRGEIDASTVALFEDALAAASSDVPPRW